MSGHDFDSLLQAWQNGTLTDTETAALESILLKSPESRARFRQLAQFDATIRDWADSKSDSDLSAWIPPTPESARSAPSPSRRWYASHPGTVLAVAASIALLASITSFFVGDHQASQQIDSTDSRSETNFTGFAVLTRSWDAVFDETQAPAPRIGDTLPTGRISLRQGIAQIEFFSGATLLLEGDSELDIHSAWKATCLRGTARVRVPPPARGFQLATPGMDLVDLGTEFGVRVNGADGKAEVHVFDGEVEAHPEATEMTLLRTGESMTRDSGGDTSRQPADATLFTSIEQMDANSAAHSQQRYEQWFKWSQQHRRDPRLLAYYRFKHWEEDRWDRLVNNFTEPKNPAFTGGAVGARWTTGRWPMKDALEFKGPGDRVRILLDCETFDAITLAGWVQVDGLDRKYNALLLTDGYEPGEPHWQIYEDGSLMFSIAYPSQDDPEFKQNQIYHSPAIFTLANQRRWHHLAVTYDGQTGECVQYVDGNEVSREVSEFHAPGRPINFGPAEIGNWGLPTEKHQFPIRNLNGRIDEFAIYKTALPAPDIAELYEQGRPD